MALSQINFEVAPIDPRSLPQQREEPGAFEAALLASVEDFFARLPEPVDASRDAPDLIEILTGARVGPPRLPRERFVPERDVEVPSISSLLS